MMQVLLAAFVLGGSVVASVLFAAAVSPSSVGSWILIAYVVLVAQVTGIVTVLSPGGHVTSAGLALAVASIVIAAAGIWWMRGFPFVSCGPLRGAAAEILGDRVVAAFAVVVGLALVYELVLVLTVPPNDWDSLVYHLARVAEWVQRGGVHWIPNAPTDRMNEFQSVAEQGILFLFVATGATRLFALPQYVAQLAILIAIYSVGRQLGYGRRPSACAALLFATFTLVALEATTAQNDLVAASLPVTAAALLLVGAGPEVLAAGVAVGLGLGVKLTTLLVLPILLVLVFRLGRRRAVQFAVAAVGAFAALGMWSFVLNDRHTGFLFGNGGGRVEFNVPASPAGVALTGARALYRLLDLSGFTVWPFLATTVMAWCVACVIVVTRREGDGGGTRLLRDRLAPAWPFLAPALVVAAASIVKAVTTISGIDMNDPRFTYPYTPFSFRFVTELSEDRSAFGPFAGIALLAVIVASLLAVIRLRSLSPKIALGLALPVFAALLGLLTKYNVFLPRFLLVPVALTTPLLAALFHRRDVTTAIAVIASLTVGLALVKDGAKPFDTPSGHPWNWQQADAMRRTLRPDLAPTVIRLESRVGPHACVGALLLGGDEPAYLLYGRRLERRVIYLTADLNRQKDKIAALPWIIIGGKGSERAVAQLQRRGWRLERPEGSSWTLAANPRPSHQRPQTGDHSCVARSSEPNRVGPPPTIRHALQSASHGRA